MNDYFNYKNNKLEGNKLEGTEKRVAQLFEEHNRTLHRFLLSKLNSEQDAQDVAQEAYVRLLRLNESDTISHPKAFLFKTAERLAIDRLRKRKCKDYRNDNEIDLDALELVSDDLPDALVDIQQRYQRLPALLNKLPPKCRMAFMLYTTYGLSYSQIALNMRLTESMVRKYVLRALRYIQENMSKTDG